MNAATLTPLLLRVRDAGVRLCVREDTGALAARPSSKLTPELRALGDYKRWREALEGVHDALGALGEEGAA
jgi:hypothetical protein